MQNFFSVRNIFWSFFLWRRFASRVFEISVHIVQNGRQTLRFTVAILHHVELLLRGGNERNVERRLRRSEFVEEVFVEEIVLVDRAANRLVSQLTSAAAGAVERGSRVEAARRTCRAEIVHFKRMRNWLQTEWQRFIFV